ncbi:DNA-(apurinic or apyrimidinic site) lyase 1 [Madurella mycetomatis]|uniref:Apurinic-apyrimidinic endonuclease 1 n=1 Tax=Madurella mycetomatis TaxID=100816 RepID=A0A175W2X0_9PEZI|nr:DNA-(apurinic or apyrimidinic site) lyase 1 [Madurella mycetomatis]KXX78098.1 DNA-(apurinic or apyrimidinic site) lyase 1 [Madurella mycetomatis]
MVRKSSRKALQSKSVVSETRIEKAAAAASVNGTKTAAAESKAEVNNRNVSKRKATRTEPDIDGEDVENINPAEDKEGGEDLFQETKKPAVKKRKTGSNKDANDKMSLAARTALSSLKREMCIGAHVSAAGGVQNAIQNASNIGANAFALFLKSQRKWTSPPLADEARTQFHAMRKQHNYNAKLILPHGSYLVNLAQTDAAKATQAYENFVDDLRRCEALGISLYNFHPGSTGGASMESACARIASQLNKAHKATGSVVTVLENMCGSGNVVGARFEELRDIIALVEDKTRVGVCIDTCHAFAAGYDLRSPEAFEATMAEFDKVVGMKYLRAFHLNDSKAPFGSHRDLHANIGTGFLGLRAFHNIMNHEPLQGLPMVLETPIEEKGPDGKMVENKQIWADEIKLLESLIGMDAESAEFKAKAEELQAKGAAEMKRIQEQVDKKAEKDAKKGTKGKRKSKKKDEDSCDSCGESD